MTYLESAALLLRALPRARVQRAQDDTAVAVTTSKGFSGDEVYADGPRGLCLYTAASARRWTTQLGRPSDVTADLGEAIWLGVDRKSVV